MEKEKSKCPNGGTVAIKYTVDCLGNLKNMYHNKSNGYAMEINATCKSMKLLLSCAFDVSKYYLQSGKNLEY